MWGRGKELRRQREIYEIGDKSMDGLIEQSRDNEELAKNVAERIKNGEDFALRFDNLEIAKYVNSELASPEADDAKIHESDILAAKILRHYYDYPQDFANITFPSVEVLQSFFKIFPRGKVAVAGILESGVTGPDEIESLSEERSGYMTKPIIVNPTEEQDQNIIPTEPANKKAA